MEQSSRKYAHLDLVPWLRVAVSVPDDILEAIKAGQSIFHLQPSMLEAKAHWTTGESGEVPGASTDGSTDDDDDGNSLRGCASALDLMLLQLLGILAINQEFPRLAKPTHLWGIPVLSE